MTLVRDPELRTAPLWAQLRNHLLETIRAMQPHDRLPSEGELCTRFAVSRTVVREALNQLVVERQVYKLQGKGTFVADRREQQDYIDSNFGFSSDFIGKDRTVTRRVLTQGLRPASAREAKFLRIETGEDVIGLDRVLSVDGAPRLLVRTAVRRELTPGLDTLPMENRSLYETMRRQYGVVLRRSERWIEALNVGPEEARLLDVEPGTAVIFLESCSYGERDAPVEYYTGYHRTDEARLHFVVK